jgi:hypothetical protein
LFIDVEILDHQSLPIPTTRTPHTTNTYKELRLPVDIVPSASEHQHQQALMTRFSSIVRIMTPIIKPIIKPTIINLRHLRFKLKLWNGRNEWGTPYGKETQLPFWSDATLNTGQKRQ